MAAGAEVDARFDGTSHQETPLHWAASSNDVTALDALLDAGADIEAEGAILGGGSPLADACGFGNWAAARRLVDRGAVPRFKDAASLGMLALVKSELGSREVDRQERTEALWYACNGNQLAAVELLAGAGADLNWVGWDDLTPLDVALQADAPELVEWLRSRGARTAAELGIPPKTDC